MAAPAAATSSAASTASFVYELDPATAARLKFRAETEEAERLAAESWQEAERALYRAVRDAKRRTFQAEDLRASSPLRRGWDAAQEPGAQGPGPPSPSSAAVVEGPSSEEEAALRGQTRTARIAAARAVAPRARAMMLHRRVGETKEKLVDHGKRKLRAKITSILVEVKRRQALEKAQERARKFREQREKMGRGPSAAIGDADPYALGIACLSSRGERVEKAASPRRSCILEALTMEELDMLRKDPWFFFTENHALVDPSSTTATGAGPGSEQAGAAAASSSPSWRSRPEQAHEDPSLEGLVDFFTPGRNERGMSVEAFAQHLRALMAAQAAEAAPKEAPEPPVHRGPPSFSEPPPPGAMERMPCQGRRPAAREDWRSPTLQKVREVYLKRELMDAKWVEERREAMVRRLNINEFKSTQQQREMQAQSNKQKELHKVRMLEAEERKAVMEAEFQDRLDNLNLQKQRRVLEANDKAEERLEEKRSRATEMLDQWYAGVERSERFLRNKERQQVQVAEANWSSYMGKLWKIGLKRHNSMESQSQKNDRLKTKIQSSLIDQLTEQRRAYSESLMEHLQEKLAAAEERRRNGMRGARYHFAERAFGSAAGEFDIKYHTVAVDRRTPTWKSNTEAWSKESVKFGGSQSDSALLRLTSGTPTSSPPRTGR